MVQALNKGIDNKVARKIADRTKRKVLFTEGWGEPPSDSDGEEADKDAAADDKKPAAKEPEVEVDDEDEDEEYSDGEDYDDDEEDYDDDEDEDEGTASSNSRVISINSTSAAASSTKKGKKTSQLTNNFVDSLKSFYAVAKERAKQNSATNPVTESAAHVPAPNFVPTPSLATVMKDVMAAQAQPWLISPEARAPQLSANAVKTPQQQVRLCEERKTGVRLYRTLPPSRLALLAAPPASTQFLTLQTPPLSRLASLVVAAAAAATTTAAAASSAEGSLGASACPSHRTRSPSCPRAH